MLSLNLLSIDFSVGSFGPEVTAIGHLGPGAPGPVESAISLRVPWRDVQSAEPFHLLSWHTAISEFAGRAAEEMQDLVEWVRGGPAVSLRFLTGEGGTGKSRLAAELATRLQEEGWAAGFVGRWRCGSVWRPGTRSATRRTWL